MKEIRKAHTVEGNVIALDPSENRLLQIGSRFSATDRIGRTFQYRYLGVFVDGPICLIYLHNETWDSFIDVEFEWFNQRKIVILEQDGNANENESENVNGTED